MQYRNFLVALLSLLLPTMASAGGLDDFYLSRLVKQPSAQLFKAVVGEASGTASVDRCLTPIYRSLKRDWAKLEPTTQKTLAKQVALPVLQGEATYGVPGGRFTIHFATTGVEVPDLTDANSNGIPDWVETVAAVFEHVYDVEVTSMGYKSPPVEAPAVTYQVYLKNLAAQDTYGLTIDYFDLSFPPNGVTSVPTYIVIDAKMTSSNLTFDGTYEPIQLLQVTAAHEFQHSIQFGYNYYFSPWYAEATATWMEDEVYDTVNQLYTYLSGYLPYTGSVSLDSSSPLDSPYGRWIFDRYLAQRHSASMIKSVWVALDGKPPVGHNDIPMLPLIDTVLTANGSSLPEEFFSFAQNFYLRAWTTHPGDEIPTVSPVRFFSSFPFSASLSAGSVISMPGHCFAYYQFLPSATAPTNLQLTFSTLPAGTGVVAFKKTADGTITPYALDQATGTITVPSFNSGQTTEVQLLISNNGPIDGSNLSFSTDGTRIAAATTAASSGGKSGCFIATAAYGSYLHPKVAELRAFRDKYLLTNLPGRLFVSLYYWASPPLADLIARHELLRGATRLLLAPVVLVVEHGRTTLMLLFLGVVLAIAVRIRFAVSEGRRAVLLKSPPAENAEA
jgi:hypothetical protein